MRTYKIRRVDPQFAFPIDMLRWTQSWPATQDDSNLIARMVALSHEEDRANVDQEITLATYQNARLVARDAWRKCGWEVVEEKK